MSTLKFNGTVVNYGTSVTDLIVNAATATNGVYTVSTVAGAAYYRNVTVNYGYVLNIPVSADFRVNEKLMNSGIITSAAGTGANVGTTAFATWYGGAGGSGGGGYSAGGDAASFNNEGDYGTSGGAANETFLTGTISSYTSAIPAATGTGSAGANGQQGSGGSAGGGGAGGGGVKIIAKIFENNGIVDVRGVNGGNGARSSNNRGTGDGGGGGGGGGSIWLIADQLTGYGNFYATGGTAGSGGSEATNNHDGKGGRGGGAGGSGAIRLDVGTKSSYIGFFYPSEVTYFKFNFLDYVPDPFIPSSSVVNAPVYTFGSSSTENKKITNKMFQSSETKIVNTNQTLSTALSPYYYRSLIISTNCTLTVEERVVIYCSKLQIDNGGILRHGGTYSTFHAGENGANWNGTGGGGFHGKGGGGGGYGTDGTGGGGNNTAGYGGGGIAYNFLALNEANMYKDFYSSTESYHGGSRGGAGGSGERIVDEWCNDENGVQYACRTREGNPGGGGAGGGFVKIFAWETLLNGTWSAKGYDGGDGAWKGGSGGSGSGGGIMLVTGKIAADATYGKIDIRGGNPGQPQMTDSQPGGTGGVGRAYIFAAENNLSLSSAVTFPGSPGTVLMNTNDLVTSTVDSSMPTGNMSLYSKTTASSLYNADNEKIFGIQSLIKTLRPKEWFTIAHSLNEFDYNYVAKIQKNSLNPVTLSSFSNYTKLGALKEISGLLVSANSTTSRLTATTLPYHEKSNTTTAESVFRVLGSNVLSYFGGTYTGGSNESVIVNSIQYNPASYTYSNTDYSIIHVVQSNNPYRLYTWWHSTDNSLTSMNLLFGTSGGSAVVGDSGHTLTSMVIDPAGNHIFLLFNRGVGVLGTTVNYIRSMKFKGWINGSDFGYTHNVHTGYSTGAAVVVGATTAITAGGGYPVAPGVNFPIARCMAIHPSGSRLYVASCSTSSDFGKTTVQRFSVDQTTGLITLLSNSSELANNMLIGTYPVSMFCDPTGKWLYVSCSSTLDGTQSSLAAYLVENGTIIPKEETFFSETGKPSCFAFDMTGSFIYLGYGTGTSNWIRTFKINQSTGELTEVLPVASTDYANGSLKRIVVDSNSRGDANRFLYVFGNNSSSLNLYVTCFSINTITGELKFINKSFFDYRTNVGGSDTTMDIEPRRSSANATAGLLPRILAGTTYNARTGAPSFRIYTQSGIDPYYQQEFKEDNYLFESNVSGLVKVWPAIQAPSSGSLTVNFSSSDYFGNSGDNTSPLALNIIPFASPLSF